MESIMESTTESIMDAYSILWADLTALKRRWPKFLITTLVSPLLYLVAFGWGLGRGMSLNGISYLEVVIPGIIALTAMTTSFNGAGNRLNVDRLFYKSFDECLMAPIGLTSLLIGKALIGVVRGLISSVAFLAVALLIAPAMHIGPLFLAGLILTCLTFAFLGVLAALLARSHEDMATFGSLILMPMTFLGGTFFSLSQVPVGLKYALYILPLTHASLFLRAVALDQPLPWTSFLALGAFFVIFLLGGMMALKRASV
jgi:ABC-type multidrug transport system permease subunit